MDGAFPLSCAETLQPGCELSYDLVDVVHAIENVLAAVTTLAAFWLLGAGLRAEPRLARVGTLTIVLGAAWLLLTALMTSQFVIPGMDEVRGLFQRGSQVVLGAWLVVLGFGVARSPWGAETSPGVVRIDADGTSPEQVRMP